MNLETAIEPKLWNLIRSSIEAKKYTTAILDGIHLLGDIIRNVSGLESDGTTLVGAAFGGQLPKIKVTPMRTESERNIHDGYQFLLRGLYQAIRNPRSHEMHNDSERDAHALLLFIDYLIRIIDKSGGQFSLNAMVNRVLDEDYVPSEQYTGLIIKDIPQKKRLAVCCEVFNRRSQTKVHIIQYFYAGIFKVLYPEELQEFYTILSQTLIDTTDNNAIHYILNAFPKGTWGHLDIIAKMRIENKLITLMTNGRLDAPNKGNDHTGPSEWITTIIPELTLSDDFINFICNTIAYGHHESERFIVKRILHNFPYIYDEPPELISRHVNRKLLQNDILYQDLVEWWAIGDLFDDRPANDPWRAPFIHALEKGKLLAKKKKDEESSPSSSEIPF